MKVSLQVLIITYPPCFDQYFTGYHCVGAPAGNGRRTDSFNLCLRMVIFDAADTF